MKRILVLWLLLLILIPGCRSLSTPKKRDPYAREIRALLARMTLQEKVGQMTQISLEVLKDQEDEEGLLTLDPNRLHHAIVDHHVGSIVLCADRAYTIENWQAVIAQIQDTATRDTRSGIPILLGTDAAQGLTNTINATIFPASLAMAATGNVDLIQQTAGITALEMRGLGVPWNLNPMLGLGRDPLWPRFHQTYGEDPYMTAVLGAAYVKGQQGYRLSDSTSVLACMKHYPGYTYVLSGMDRTPAIIPEYQFREYFLIPYQEAARAGAATVTVHAAEIDGIPLLSSAALLSDVLHNELGFEGFVLSTWQDIMALYERNKVAGDQREAVKTAIMAGVDMVLVPYDCNYTDYLLDLVDKGEIPQERIDQAAGRILRVKLQLGLFDNPYPRKDLVKQIVASSPEQVNLHAAQEAVTLLKNSNDVLPLGKDTKVLVTGPCADNLAVLNGCPDQEILDSQDQPTILNAIREKIGPDKVFHAQGATFTDLENVDVVLERAAQADVLVACIGEPGHTDDLTLSQAQCDLVKALSNTGKPVILILVQGRPLVVRNLVDVTQAILMAYVPGREGGRALADVLFGDANPSAKLPFTYPRYPEQHVCYDQQATEESDPNRIPVQWEFGHGLSYTHFAYKGLSTSECEIAKGDSLTVLVDVTNTGQRPGKEIVQLYLSDLVASVTPPVKRLKRFKKISLEPGRTQTVRFELTPADFSFIGPDNKPIVAPGDYCISIGPLSQNFVINKP